MKREVKSDPNAFRGALSLRLSGVRPSLTFEMPVEVPVRTGFVGDLVYIRSRSEDIHFFGGVRNGQVDRSMPLPRQGMLLLPWVKRTLIFSCWASFFSLSSGMRRFRGSALHTWP